MRPLPEPRITRVDPYTARLFVHQYVVRTPDDVDATFAAWVHEAFRVGEGDHLRAGPTDHPAPLTSQPGSDDRDGDHDDGRT